MSQDMLLATLVFLVTYALIITEVFNRTVIALVGAMLMMGLKLISHEGAIDAIDFNTMGLLVGMMVIVTIVKRTGLFEYLAIKSAKVCRGEPMQILIVLSMITAVASAFLDNVTTVLLIAPVTLSITRTLNITPYPFLIAEILASNVGGASTLVGDPPNIMIGTAVGLSFIEFLVNMGPVVIVVQIVNTFLLYLIYRNQLKVTLDLRRKIMNVDERECIKQPELLVKSLSVLGLTILTFLFHSKMGYEPATVALMGAALLLLISKLDPEEIFKELEWKTLFFFGGLFILVGAVVEVGLIEVIAKKALVLTGGDVAKTGYLILWFGAIASSFVDNIPFVTTMIPLIKSIGTLGGMDVSSIWWTLALGACFGGNGTLIGATANVVVAGISEKQGYPLSFWHFFKIGFPLMLISIIISNIYIYFKFYF